MKFWDREKERNWMKKYLLSEPNAILFVYGPKSSGKSTLLMRVIKELARRKRFKKNYKLYWFDLRGRLVSSYENVIDMFFVDKDTEASREMESEFNLSLPMFFKVSNKVKEEIREKKVDPFVYMENILRNSGKKNIIIFDELQKLKDVYLDVPNNQRLFIKELFNFFVRLTKVLHLSHVLVMSSDTFFIEEVYTDSTLKNTSRFYFVDFFPDETAKNLLIKEGFDEKDAEYVVEWIGGIPWMLYEVVKGGVDIINELYENERSRMKEVLLNYDEEEKAIKIFRSLLEGSFKLTKENIKIVKDLVEKEILFYDPVKGYVKFQTKLDERAAKELLNY